MDLIRIIFIEALKALGLLFLSLLASKANRGLRPDEAKGRGLNARQGVAQALVLALAIVGAVTIGYDVAAEIFARSAARKLAQRDFAGAYSSANRAVAIRPGDIRHWRLLSTAKFAQKQYSSVVADAPAIEGLSPDGLSEEDAYRLAVAHFLLGEYKKVYPLTTTLMKGHPHYAAPFVLEGYARLAQQQNQEATDAFMDLLRKFPENQSAVEGLAHAQFLSGKKGTAISILEQTAQYKFPPEAQSRFEALKGLYALD